MGKIIGVVSIKGGVGKTTTVINLANALANSCKQKVLVVDANFSAPNLRLNLGLDEPEKGIHEMINKDLDPFEAIYDTDYGFHILPAKLNNKKSTKVSSLNEYLNRIKKNYDFIILDSSPNVNAEIISTINSSDSLFVIVTPDFSALSCTMHSVQLAKENGTPIEGLIVNKTYGSKNEINLNEIEEAAGAKILAVIPHHEDIYESTLKTIPVELQKRKEYGKEYLELAKYLVLSENPSKKLKLSADEDSLTNSNRIEAIKNLKD